MKHLFSAMGSALLLALPAAAGTAPVITVDAAKTVAPVNRLGFGHNLEAADGRGIFDEPASAAAFNLGGVKFGQGLWNPERNAPNPLTAGELGKLRAGMMRYPGGCLAHSFNWMRAVGPLSGRPEWKFGIDQFLALCRRMNWEPVFTLTDYALPAEELPQHLAELVEYLNAPAVPEHPWAMKRADWGHPEPYGVKYFELGNESKHGSHKTIPVRSYTPEQYVRYAVESAKAIRRVDPSVKLGIVTVPGDASDWNCDWNRKVIAGAGPAADFLVIHIYGPGVDGTDAKSALRRALAYPDQLAVRLGQYRGLARELAGKELPLAVTEYNVGGFASDPFPVRFSALAGLMNADLLRLWQQPENRVEFANYWHILNGYWGGLRTDAEGTEIKSKKATLPFLEAWGKFRGDEIVVSEVSGNPRVAAEAGPGLRRSSGEHYVAEQKIGEQRKFKVDPAAFTRSGIEMSATGAGSFRFRFKEAKNGTFPVFSRIVRPEALAGDDSLSVSLSFEMRFLPEKPGERPQAIMGLGLCDPRGWSRTRSAAAFTLTAPPEQWTKVGKSFTTLAGAPGPDLLFRLENVSKPVSGTLEIRNLKAELSRGEKFPAYPALTTFATKSADGRTLYLIVFNRDPGNAVTVKTELKNFRTAGGESLLLHAENPESTDYFTGLSGRVTVTDGCFETPCPPGSMTAFRFESEED